MKGRAVLGHLNASRKIEIDCGRNISARLSPDAPLKPHEHDVL